MGRNLWLLMAATLALFFATGCETTGTGPITSPTDAALTVDTNTHGAFIRVSEQLKIEFRDIVPPVAFEQTVREDGTITLAHGQTFVAAGKNETDLQKEIHDRYVPNYYVRLTINIKRENRYYFVDGQVKNPSQRPYTGDITVLNAIASAGGFTVFANTKKVELIRSTGQKVIVNAEKARKDPKLDLRVYPGDKIIVPLSKI